MTPIVLSSMGGLAQYAWISNKPGVSRSRLAGELTSLSAVVLPSSARQAEVWTKGMLHMKENQTDLVGLATRAYTYGFPLVFNLRQVLRYTTTGIGANAAAPFNAFSHARTLATPADQFVTINNDTVYSMAQVDLSAGPVELVLAPTGDRYVVLQMVSAWTENYAYLGTRGTGRDGGRFWLVPLGWAGSAPDDATVVEVPTTISSVVGRWAVDSPADLAEVHALQDRTTLGPAGATAVGDGLPTVDVEDEALRFWEEYRLWSLMLPPPGRDRVEQAAFEPLGLTGGTPVMEAAPEVIEALRAGFSAGQAAVAESLQGGHVPNVNGWLLAFHAFDYNLENLGLGTIDAPEYRIEDDADRYLMRAGAALGGLWGNHAYEAAYAAIYTDEEGAMLTGERRYQVTFSPPPPTDAFWSLTMYDVPDYYLVDNSAGRYSIGDRTPGLITNADGSITITISSERPTDPVQAANWLPAPAGPFRPILRVYLPGQSVLDMTYPFPPIRRIE